MSLRSHLASVVEGMPEGASVSLPVDWIRSLLEEEPEAGVPELLDLEEVAEIVGRAVSTVRTWCNTGELEGAFKLRGREWKVPREALRRFLEEQGSERPDPTPSGPVDLGSWRTQRERRTG